MPTALAKTLTKSTKLSRRKAAAELKAAIRRFLLEHVPSYVDADAVSLSLWSDAEVGVNVLIFDGPATKTKSEDYLATDADVLDFN